MFEHCWDVAASGFKKGYSFWKYNCFFLSRKEKEQNKMEDKIGNRIKVTIREYKEDIDIEVVKKLEKNCKQESEEGISMFTNFIDDPLCRIRLYPLHVMLVAELREKGELVGVVRGCIKCVGTGCEGRDVKLGSILGLRVSSKHRRMGIGSKLVETIEEWMMHNGVQYIFLAAEEKNVASKNLFTLKYNYEKLCSLAIYVQPTSSPFKDPSQDIEIEKLPINQAISFYNTRLGGKYMLYPTDIDAILKEKLSLGTWLCYSKETNQDDDDQGNSMIAQNSWAIFSIWNTCDARKFQTHNSPFPPTFKFLHSTLSHARKKIFPCLNLKVAFSGNSLEKPYGFFFVFGIYGEGERVREVMEYVWRYASSLAGNVKNCNAIMTEFGVCDPMREYVPQESCISCIEDLWYVKRVKEDTSDELSVMRPLRNVFVDPRDF